MKTDDVSRYRTHFFINCLNNATPVVLFLSLFFLGFLSRSPAAANPAPGQSSSQSNQEESEEDFLFSAPKGFIGFRIGRFFPRANSDLYDEITDDLTLEKNDLRAWDIGFDGGFALNERLDAVFTGEYLKRTKSSEVRDWVDAQDLPITQETYYSQLPLTAGLKFYLIPRGRRIGRYAWLPSRVVPFAGAGAGVLWYRFGQSGRFVEESYTEEGELVGDIFYADLESSGWTATGYIGGGVDINIAKYTYLTLDLRYSWAKPELDPGVFVGFDPLDLSGPRATAGLQWHF